MSTSPKQSTTAPPPPPNRRVRVTAIQQETSRIRSYELMDPEGGELPPFTAGAHIDVYIPGGHVRQYSLCNDPAERHRYVLGVLREDNRRGGSAAFHNMVREGDELEISAPRNHFKLREEAASHLLIAGGIGVTPLLSMIARLNTIGREFRMFYCTRSLAETAFVDRLRSVIEEGRVVLHHDFGERARSLNLQALLARQANDQQLYVCGPPGLMTAVRRAASHWSPGSVHMEHFQALPGAEPNAAGTFIVRLVRSGLECVVPPGASIVDVLRANGVEVDTMCENGVCGSCKTRYFAGCPDHRDLVLEDSERETHLMVCCARSLSPELELDL